MFTRWIVTTSSGLEEQVAKVATYFDNVVSVLENLDVIFFNTSGLINNVRVLFCVHPNNSLLFPCE